MQLPTEAHEHVPVPPPRISQVYKCAREVREDDDAPKIFCSGDTSIVNSGLVLRHKHPPPSPPVSVEWGVPASTDRTEGDELKLPANHKNRLEIDGGEKLNLLLIFCDTSADPVTANYRGYQSRGKNSDQQIGGWTLIRGPNN